MAIRRQIIKRGWEAQLLFLVSLCTAIGIDSSTLTWGASNFVAGGDYNVGGELGNDEWEIRNQDGTSTGITGTVNPRRESHCALQFANDHVFLAGGFASDTTWRIIRPDGSPALAPINAEGSLRNSRGGDHRCTLINNRTQVFITGGAGSASLKSWEIWDQNGTLIGESTSDPTTQLKVNRQLHTATLLESGKIFVAGGINSETKWEIRNDDGSFYKDDQSLGATPLEKGRKEHCAVEIGGNIFLAAGSSLNEGSTYEMRGPEGAPLGTGSLRFDRRVGLSCSVMQLFTIPPSETIFMAGGNSGLGAQDLVRRSWEIRTSNGSWSGREGRENLGSPLSAYREHHAATVQADGNILIVGGIATGATAPAYNTWELRDGNPSDSTNHGNLIPGGSGTLARPHGGHLTITELRDTNLPTAPSNLVATANGNTQIDLTWSSASDAFGISQYQVERCTGVGCGGFSQIATPSGGTTSHSDINLTTGTSYSYRVRAKDGSNNFGPYSNIVSLVAGCTLTTAPGNLTAVAGTTSVSVTWTAVTGAHHYEVYRRHNGPTYVKLSPDPTTPTFTDTGVTPETAYLYKVRAANAGGTCFSPDSNIDLAVPFVYTQASPLQVGAPIKGVDVEELRRAVNAVRTTKGDPGFGWQDPSPLAGVSVKKVHMDELRTQLTNAMTGLGLAAPTFQESIVQFVTPVRASHINEFRDKLK